VDPAAASAPACAIGKPLLGDFNGDGASEAMIGGWGSKFTITDGRTQALSWLEAAPHRYYSSASQLNSFDLNGDVCSDAVVVIEDRSQPSVQIMLGTPSGLQAGPEIVPLQAPPLGQDATIVAAVILQHDGLTQLVLVGNTTTDGTFNGNYIDVYTLDSAGGAGAPRSSASLAGTAVTLRFR
jgi:hypothetical protein